MLMAELDDGVKPTDEEVAEDDGQGQGDSDNGDRDDEVGDSSATVTLTPVRREEWEAVVMVRMTLQTVIPMTAGEDDSCSCGRTWTRRWQQHLCLPAACNGTVLATAMTAIGSKYDERDG